MCEPIIQYWPWDTAGSPNPYYPRSSRNRSMRETTSPLDVIVCQNDTVTFVSVLQLMYCERIILLILISCEKMPILPRFQTIRLAHMILRGRGLLFSTAVVSVHVWSYVWSYDSLLGIFFRRNYLLRLAVTRGCSKIRCEWAENSHTKHRHQESSLYTVTYIQMVPITLVVRLSIR